MIKTRNHNNVRTMPEGAEKLCPKCKEWWPADGEFYQPLRGGLQCWCKACANEWRYHKRNPAVPGFQLPMVAQSPLPTA